MFIGHQQLQHRFHHFQEIGPGGDAEAGLHFGRCQDYAVYGGGYYYDLKEGRHNTGDHRDNVDFNRHNFDNIHGVEARAVLPIKCNVAFTVEASYDNYQKGAVVGGLRFQIGHEYHQPPCFADRLYDPIVRNLGSLKTGSGIPIVRGTKDEGLFVFRDNIFFFTGTGGTAFNGIGTGTFENPLANNQFTQTTVDGIDAIAPNANLFLNTGTYVINAGSPGTPNARVEIPGGQSLFGRTQDFSKSAVGDERPLLLGGLDFFEGNNNVDSIRLLNEITTKGDNTGAQSIVGVNVNEAKNVHFCNSDVTVRAIVEGNNVDGGSNVARGFVIDTNSSVVFETSNLTVLAQVKGDNTAGFALGSQTGGPQVIGLSNVTTENQAIGFDVVGNNNSLMVDTAAINVTALVGGENISGSAQGGIGGGREDEGGGVAVGGSNTAVINQAIGLNVTSNFNLISLLNSQWKITAEVVSNNDAGRAIGGTGTTGDGSGTAGSGINNNTTNQSSGVRLEGDSNELDADHNTFEVGSFVGGDNSATQAFGGIGGLGEGSGAALATGFNQSLNSSVGLFINGSDNTAVLSNNVFAVKAMVGGDNEAGVAIGGVGGEGFESGIAIVTSANDLAVNESDGVNLLAGSGNGLSLSNNIFTVESAITGNNRSGEAVGGTGSIGDSERILLSYSGSSSAQNLASGVNISGDTNLVELSQNSFNVLATVAKDNRSGAGFGGIGGHGN